MIYIRYEASVLSQSLFEAEVRIIAGDTVIIISYVLIERNEAKDVKPKIILLDGNNMVSLAKDEEIHA